MLLNYCCRKISNATKKNNNKNYWICLKEVVILKICPQLVWDNIKLIFQNIFNLLFNNNQQQCVYFETSSQILKKDDCSSQFFGLCEFESTLYEGWLTKM